MSKLRKRPVTNVQLLEAQEEFQNESDRGCALLGAAQVDYLLGKAIEMRLERREETKQALLFDPMAPLSSFSARTLAAYAMRIIGPITRSDIDIIRDVRNDFAHTVGSVDFGEPSIARRCMSLQHPRLFASAHGHEVESIIFNPRMMYVTAVVFFAGDLKVFVGYRDRKDDKPLDIEK